MLRKAGSFVKGDRGAQGLRQFFSSRENIIIHLLFRKVKGIVDASFLFFCPGASVPQMERPEKNTMHREAVGGRASSGGSPWRRHLHAQLAGLLGD